MKTIKYTLATLMVAAIVAVVLVGCKKENNGQESKMTNNAENKEIKLKLNNINIGLNEFTQTFMINTIFSMVHSLKIDQEKYNTLTIKMSEENNSLTVNEENIKINTFVKKILKETIYRSS